MSSKIKMLAIAAALAAGTSTGALAQVCPPGYAPYGSVCQPVTTPAPGTYAPNNPVSGAAAGAASGAAAGAAAAGPVGAIVGGALGTAGGAVAGTVNGVTGAPVAPVGTAYPTSPAYPAYPAYGSSMPPAAPVTINRCGPGRTEYLGYCYPAD